MTIRDLALSYLESQQRTVQLGKDVRQARMDMRVLERTLKDEIGVGRSVVIGSNVFTVIQTGDDLRSWGHVAICELFVTEIRRL